jgi:hypothetical protein
LQILENAQLLNFNNPNNVKKTNNKMLVMSVDVGTETFSIQAKNLRLELPPAGGGLLWFPSPELVVAGDDWDW